MKRNKNVIVNLKIADVVIRIQSAFCLKQLSEEEKKLQLSERFDNFVYKGKEKPDISICVKIVDKLPQISGTRPLFITYHFQDGKENWCILRKGSSYIYKSPLEGKEQLMVVNKSFNKITAYFFAKENKNKEWSVTDIIYDFLQVLLINYFAQRKSGIFVHSVGIKDVNGEGLFFAGKSGCGKSTTARLWYKFSQAMILNDDRIIVRKIKGKFFIYGSPWHGEFSDYLKSRIESAVLKKMFFIYHAKNNIIKRINQKEAFNLLYPALFPVFWDKQYLENIVSFSQDLIKNVTCYSLGFVNNKQVINFVRKVENAKKTQI